MILEEAEALKPGWGESIVPEAHWLHNNIQEEIKAVDAMKAKVRPRSLISPGS